jgi:hypothetical protein
MKDEQMQEYTSPDEVKKTLNDSLFNHLVHMVELFHLKAGKELSQSEFQRIWQSLIVFPQLDVGYYSRKLHLDEKWVDGWRGAQKRVEVYLDTDELPKPNVTVYFLFMAITFLDEKLKPRSNNYASVFAEVEYRKHKAEQEAAKESAEFAEKLPTFIIPDGSPVLDEEMAKALVMPDGRSWDTLLEDDPKYVELVIISARNALKNENILTFKDLLKKSKGELFKVPWFGRKGFKGIQSFLDHHNLELGMNFDD